CSKLAPRAALLLRVEPQGVKPKASLDGLPGFATLWIARKTAPLTKKGIGFGQKPAPGRFFLAPASQGLHPDAVLASPNRDA
ncbi:MAG: hypothetical protein ACO226_02855, partial [Hylemonella sp.]